LGKITRAKPTYWADARATLKVLDGLRAGGTLCHLTERQRGDRAWGEGAVLSTETYALTARDHESVKKGPGRAAGGYIHRTSQYHSVTRQRAELIENVVLVGLTARLEKDMQGRGNLGSGVHPVPFRPLVSHSEREDGGVH